MEGGDELGEQRKRLAGWSLERLPEPVAIAHHDRGIVAAKRDADRHVEQRPLVRESEMDCPTRDAGLGGDVADTGCGVAAFHEEPGRGGQDAESCKSRLLSAGG